MHREERDISLDHLPATHIEYLDTHPASIERIAEDVASRRVGRNHVLFIHDRFDCSNLVA